MLAKTKANRDLNRINKSSATVRANLVQHFHKYCLNHVKEITNSKTDNEVDQMWDLALSSNTDISTLFNKSQTGLSSRDAKRYAKTQHNLVKHSTTYGENQSTISSISPFIVTPTITKLYQSFGQITQSSDRKENNSDRSLISDNMNSLQKFIIRHWRSELPPLESKYYKPFHVARFLCNFGRRPLYFRGVLVTKKMVIESMIENQVVPFRKTTLYRISSLYNCSCLSTTDTWTELTKPGRKGYLSSQGFDHIVSHICSATAGGITMPLDKIRKIIKARILFEHKARANRSCCIPVIHESTLYTYASMVLAQDIFNIHHGEMPYKTESRSAAEWSFRSTIAYALAVASTHFIPCDQPSHYAKKMKDLPKESRELWQLVEECLSDIHSNGSDVKSKVKVSPVLPNLITSTDEMTIFATATKVGKAQKVHVVAKPTSIKTEGISSANRNNYTTTSVNNSHLRGV